MFRERVDAERIPPITHLVAEPVGIDLGVTCFATISDGTEIKAPKPLKQAITRAWAREFTACWAREFTSRAGSTRRALRRDPQGKLRKLQYHNRNKQFGDRRTGVRASNNAKKYFRKLSRFHLIVADRRKDFLHKTTTGICQKYAHIRIEDLNVKGMIANRKLAASISDLGFYEFRRQMEYKAPSMACKLDIIDQWFPSSKQCRKCKHKNNDLTLNDRTFNCPSCGHKEPRDLHAAINLAFFTR